jgi:hypothetical protein
MTTSAGCGGFMDTESDRWGLKPWETAISQTTARNNSRFTPAERARAWLNCCRSAVIVWNEPGKRKRRNRSPVRRWKLGK